MSVQFPSNARCDDAFAGSIELFDSGRTLSWFAPHFIFDFFFSFH